MMKTQFKTLFLLLPLIFLLSACSGSVSKVKTDEPLSIIYPQNGTNISNDRVVVVAKVSPDIYNARLLLDGKTPEGLTSRKRMDTYIFSFPLTTGEHTVEINATGGKEISRDYKNSITINIQPPGPLRLKPISEAEYFSVVNASSMAGVELPAVSFTKNTLLVRTQRGKSELYWVVPREDRKKAEEVMEREPHLKLTSEKGARPPLVCGFSGTREGYSVVQDSPRTGSLVFHYLDSSGKEKTQTLKTEDILRRAFEERLVPATWWKEETYIMKWKTASVLPEPAIPMQCSQGMLLVPLQFHCVYVKCSPSVVPGYLILEKNGSYHLYISNNARYEGYGWRGSEVLIPVKNTVAVLDLKNATYRLYEGKKQYPLPLIMRLPDRLSREFYFQRNTLKPVSDSTTLSQNISEEDHTLYGMIEVVFSDHIALKQSLFFVDKTAGMAALKEVPLYYEIQTAD